MTPQLQEKGVWWKAFRPSKGRVLVGGLGVALLWMACCRSGSRDLLDPGERQWLRANEGRLVVAVETGYAPFVFLDDRGQPRGLAQDHLRLLESKLGVRFQQRNAATLDEIFARVRSGEVQVVNAVTETPWRSEFIAFTRPFISVPNVIIVRKEHSGDMSAEQLRGLRVSLVRSYAITEDLTRRNLGLLPVLVPDDLTGLLEVSFGRSDAAVTDLATASYLIEQKGITNLRVAGEAGLPIQLAMGTARNEPRLHAILQKGLATITETERQAIRKRWISASDPSLFADWRFWLAVGIFLSAVLAVLAAILTWNRTLRRQVALRTRELNDEKAALQESGQKFRSFVAQYDQLVASIPIGVYLIRSKPDETFAFEFISPRMAELFGVELERLRADVQLAFQAVHPEDSEAFVKLNQDGLRQTVPFYWEGRVRVEGATRWLHIESIPKRMGDGDVLWHGFVTDITERMTRDQALRSSQELLSKAFAVSPDAYAITTLEDGVYLRINEGFTRVLGYTEAEVLGHSSLDERNPLWADPRDRERLVADLKAKGEVIDLEAIFLKKGGRAFPGLMSARIFEVNGAKSIVSITRDITDRKHAEERVHRRITALTQPLEGSEVTFEDLFNLDEIQRIQDEFAAATGVASIITHPDGTPITGPSHFTYLCSELIRKTEKGCSNCFKSDAALGRFHPNGPIVQRCLSGGLWDAGASIFVGGTHVANWLIGQVRDESQSDEGMAAYAREIGVDEAPFLEAFHAVPSMSRQHFEQIAQALFTLAHQLSTAAYQNIQQARFIAESKRAQEEKARLQAQLMQVQKMESLGSLAGGVAHDMNNVLGAILGMATANIGAHPPGSPTYRAFDTITQAATRGGKMVKSLLGFARQSPAEEHELDVNEILREEMRLLERTTLAQVRLELDLAEDLHPIRGDASILTHAFMNLCVNAVDAMAENGTLTLRTRNVDEDWIEVLVEDTGAGMPREVLEKALDPFFTTKEVGKGTGLGLSMVYSTVKAHRGELELQSEPGVGTRVRMRFPACRVPGPAPELAESRSEPPHKALKVLVVDDDELILCSVQALLEILGHDATLAACGEEALARLEAGFEPDVVILDMNMPGLGGAGTLPQIRRLRPALPVLLATGRVDQAASDLVHAHPSVTLLSKPYSKADLQRNLDALGQD